MALFLSSSHPSHLIRNPKSSQRLSAKLSFSSSTLSLNPNFSSFRINSTSESDSTAPIPINKPTELEASKETSATDIVDEWGEKAEPERESSFTKFSSPDPPQNEDEWGGAEAAEESKEESYASGNGSATALYDKLGDLKRALVDSFYGTELGFRASPEARAEISELVSQLESCNPTPAPTSSASLDGNWVLLYTAFSELLPLLAAGATPLLKLEKICQSIDTKTLTIENSTTFSNLFASFSFSASATFEVRTPSRIQVTFKEGILNPPEITSRVSLPENLDIFGQKLDLSVVQNSLNPLEDIVANISRIISGQPPLKLPIPGDRSSSWLITTYLDDDLRISRGDGGLFILAKEGSPLRYL